MTVIVDRQEETEVFINQAGGVTILQKRWPDGDVHIAIPFHRIGAMIDALIDLREEGGGHD